MGRPGGVIAFHHGSDLLHGFRGLDTLADENAGPAVSRVHGGAGDNQVSHTGQSREGFPLGAQGETKPGCLRQAPGHEHGLCIVAEAAAVGNTGAQGNDVFQCAAQLHTGYIRIGVDPEAVRHESILDTLGQGLVGVGGDTAGGDSSGHLFGVTGTGENRDVVACHLLGHLAHTQKGIRLDALGHGDQLGLLIQIGGEGLTNRPEGEGGGRQHHHLPVRHTSRVPGDMQLRREGDSRQHGILPGQLHFFGLFRVVGPQGDPVTVFAQVNGQGRTPAAASRNRNVHVRSSLCPKDSFRSVPWIRRLMLPLCINMARQAAAQARISTQRFPQ